MGLSCLFKFSFDDDIDNNNFISEQYQYECLMLMLGEL